VYLYNLHTRRHHNQSLLYTGSEKDKIQNVGQRHAINYLSLHDNKILRQFRGHSGEVTSISMSPVDDSFLTSSKDGSIRLWDLKQAGSLASMDMPKSGKGMMMDFNGCPLAAYDSTGLVFGITAPLEANAGHVSIFKIVLNTMVWVHGQYDKLDACDCLVRNNRILMGRPR